ncbi:MAG: D-alanyl-D-alanine carboxypeptidase [Lachnospiraceae bacterium]
MITEYKRIPICLLLVYDACVAMAEFIDGSEKAFVKQMNKKAHALGMKDTKFVNCCGLDADGHQTSAYDIALMSRELTIHHPQIHEYSTIWMENITHTTKKGSSEFGLANTNKLIKQYKYATGLKTGSTSLAKYSVSATAVKNNVELIAVILAAPDYKVRFTQAMELLNYGFSKCKVYQDKKEKNLPLLSVKGGKKDHVSLTYVAPFTYVDVKGINFKQIKCIIKLPKTVTAPLKKGEAIGSMEYRFKNKILGSISICCNEAIEKTTLKFCILKILSMFSLG